jgi:hypothetical protein
MDMVKINGQEKTIEADSSKGFFIMAGVNQSAATLPQEDWR